MNPFPPATPAQEACAAAAAAYEEIVGRARVRYNKAIAAAGRVGHPASPRRDHGVGVGMLAGRRGRPRDQGARRGTSGCRARGSEGAEMSRYNDYDGDLYESFPNQSELWEANLRRALAGKRGRQALADLREALLALPSPRLIEGSMCTVGAERRTAELSDWAYAQEKFAATVEEQGEGVCSVGAYIWYQEVKAGVDPAEAFDRLPTLYGDEESDAHTGAIDETAQRGVVAGLARVLAWELAYLNDETFGEQTPEGRHAVFLRWIDTQLAGSEPAHAT